MKQRIKPFFNKLKSKLGVAFSKLKKGYIILCKWFSDMIHNRAGNAGLLLSFACIVFICVVEPIIDVFQYSNSLWLLVVGEIIYALFTVFFVSSTILYNRRGICYWITSLLLIVRYVTLIDIGAEWNRQFGIYYLGLAFIFFCSWGSWVSAKDINRKGGIFDTVILAIGLALFVVGLISKNGDYQYYKYLIVAGIALVYLYAIARSMLQIFFSHNNIKIDLFKTMIYVVIYIALIVGLPFLLKYSGVKEEVLSGTIIPIYAAAIGGILTLAGVAWTIKHGERNRKDDEKLSRKPYLVLDEVPLENISDTNKLNIRSDNIGQLKTKFEFIEIYVANHADCFFAGLLINGVYYPAVCEKFMRKDNCYLLEELVFEKSIKTDTVYFVVKALLGNYYKFECYVKENAESNEKIYLCYECYEISPPIELNDSDWMIINNSKERTNE